MLANVFDSFVSMIREQTIRARDKLSGSLVERTVWHREGCPK
jgi:hypothetical protein